MATKKIRLKVESLLKDPFAIRFIEDFEVAQTNGDNLAKYIKKYAVNDELRHEARTYLVRDADTGEIVAYFSLKAGIQTTDEYTDKYGRTVFDCMPGIELSNWAINSKYKQKYNISAKIGAHVLNKYILPIVAHISKWLGVSVLFIYSLPHEKLIEWYRTHGFKRLERISEQKLHERIKPSYDEGCVFMYMPIDSIISSAK